MKKTITNQEVAALSNASVYPFPKYTTMLINQINQTAQGTRPKVVGQMSELIKEFDGQTLDEWKRWYDSRQPQAIDKATAKIYAQFLKLKEAMNLIDENLIREWVKDLVYNKTFCGLRVQQAIIAFIAEEVGKKGKWRLATKDEEAKGIDGYIDGKPVQVKSSTYKTEFQLREVIKAPIVYYEKKKSGLTVEFNPEDFKS
ncbi:MULTISPECIES: MjaI family restriction endonuclease [Prevotella]|uniref:Type II restriction endonuclease MjaI n=1 Tax=Prevotella lacticifex TaxID=2854755 RepID=A0A9R1CV73_9BACT|nr:MULTISPECIES: MjaI family restriction endonuclease [Prevotella]MDD6852962.1 MjaI family restriction endonuclease [Prevotella sp.]GJG37877.1 type II restriction endonuclease MjaI [Prevotella lacticifex]GJG41167.1 type II restriction endonuclease MjaI [Prevotella lacticifex]GJG43360.1 type II restriction endonuclease MjaI [Prevotella lacticifex]GJG47142.1 type II restriction endonuclease MjaI [Prevotella lacticifex]